MQEFWQSIKRGTPMTRHFLWRALEVLGILSLIALTVSAPFIASTIKNPVYRDLTWTLFVILIMIFAISVGLMPYWGMREIKRGIDKELSTVQTRISELLPFEQIVKL